MVSVSEMAASFANRSRISARSASWLNASTMKACAVLLAAPASRAIRRLRPSGSLRLVADMDDALHSMGSQKVLPTRIKVKLSSEPTSYRPHDFRIRRPRNQAVWHDEFQGRTTCEFTSMFGHEGIPQ